MTGSRPESLRTCVGCRRRDPRSDLLRVVAVDGTVVPDPSRRLEGRGAHLHPAADCFVLAERRRAWPRALRVTGPLDAARVRAFVQQLHDPDAATPAGSDPHRKQGDPIR